MPTPRSFFLLLLLALPSVSYGQQLVAAAGHSLSGGGWMLDYAVGEPLVATLADASGLTLTQGLFQPGFGTSPAVEPAPGAIAAYPNPATDEVTVRSSADCYELWSPTGKLLRAGCLDADPATLSLRDLPAGPLWLRLRTIHSSIVHLPILIVKL